MSVAADAGTITEASASTSVQSGARLDRLPISAFHKRIFWLIGAGMFFDGYDLYVGTSVLGATLASKFSTLAQNAQFVSFTFIGMTIGALAAGFLGDAYGRLECRMRVRRTLSYFNALLIRALHGVPKVSRFAHWPARRKSHLTA